MRILVTGADGFIGKNLLVRLKENSSFKKYSAKKCFLGGIKKAFKSGFVNIWESKINFVILVNQGFVPQLHG